MERGDFSGCLSPTALESAEPFDHIPFGEHFNVYIVHYIIGKLSLKEMCFECLIVDRIV